MVRLKPLLSISAADKRISQPFIVKVPMAPLSTPRLLAYEISPRVPGMAALLAVSLCSGSGAFRKLGALIARSEKLKLTERARSCRSSYASRMTAPQKSFLKYCSVMLSCSLLQEMIERRRLLRILSVDVRHFL